jgi:imidazoleglycerol phosphate dehydratase HisB
MIESLFKAFGRALRPAVARTTGGDVPSTKGVL